MTTILPLIWDGADPEPPLQQGTATKGNRSSPLHLPPTTLPQPEETTLTTPMQSLYSATLPIAILDAVEVEVQLLEDELERDHELKAEHAALLCLIWKIGDAPCRVAC